MHVQVFEKSVIPVKENRNRATHVAIIRPDNLPASKPRTLISPAMPAMTRRPFLKDTVAALGTGCMGRAHELGRIGFQILVDRRPNGGMGGIFENSTGNILAAPFAMDGARTPRPGGPHRRRSPRQWQDGPPPLGGGRRVPLA